MMHIAVLKQVGNVVNDQQRILIILQWTPLIVATSGPALSGHNNR